MDFSGIRSSLIAQAALVFGLCIAARIGVGDTMWLGTAWMSSFVLGAALCKLLRIGPPDGLAQTEWLDLAVGGACVVLAATMLFNAFALPTLVAIVGTVAPMAVWAIWALFRFLQSRDAVPR